MADQENDSYVVLGHTAQPVKTFKDIPTRRLLVNQYLGMNLAEQLPLLGIEKSGELLGILASEVQVVTDVHPTFLRLRHNKFVDYGLFEREWCRHYFVSDALVRPGNIS